MLIGCKLHMYSLLALHLLYTFRLENLHYVCKNSPLECVLGDQEEIKEQSSNPLSFPLPSNRHHRSNDDCLEGKTENYQVCSVQYCAQQLCTVRCTHTCERT